MSATLRNGPVAGPRFIMAHGAGGAMDSPAMEALAELIAWHGIHVIRFEFAYMAARRSPGASRRPPPEASRLIGEYAAMIAEEGPAVVGGKSMGGRVASMLAAEHPALVPGLVCFGYPLHPPDKPQQLRTGHFSRIRCPVLILQGERDPFGTRAEAAEFGPLENSISWLAEANHDLIPASGSGLTKRQVWAQAAALAADFIRRADSAR